MREFELLPKIKELLEQEPKLIKISGFERAVVVGDTHGDLEATQIIIERYFNKNTALIFVGDYVDRGPHSQESINTLLELKLSYPQQVILLQGNHEGWKVFPFVPADFWEGLSPEMRELYADTLAELPLVATLPNGVMAVHAALPSVDSLEQINKILLGSAEWRQITWGDWNDCAGHSLGDLGSRPQFGRDRFESLMARFGMNLLIRGHQPHAPLLLYEDRCLTIFTSSAYERPRTVAIVDLKKKIETAKNLVIEKI